MLLFLALPAAQAQEQWPSRPIHIVVPYTPGTGADILARALGPKLAERWKASVVTENRAGATGTIATAFVANAAPDGHTLLFVATSFGTTPARRTAQGTTRRSARHSGGRALLTAARDGTCTGLAVSPGLHAWPRTGLSG